MENVLPALARRETRAIHSFESGGTPEDLWAGRFSFLNLLPERFGSSVNWEFASAQDPLWRYNLHYGEWALTLSQAFLASGESRYRDALLALLSDWIANNRVGRSPGWDPYPISRRLVAWLRVHGMLVGEAVWEDFWKNRLASSLWQQARVLESNLEKDLANNHLVANYRALAWIGLLFPSWPRAGEWREMGLEGLWSEMRCQVLADGCHAERSISYHTIVLQDLLEVFVLCRSVGKRVPEDVAPTLQRMIGFLAGMQAPDGSYPMLNDTVPGYPVDPRDMLLAGGRLFCESKWITQGIGGDPSYAAWLNGDLGHSLHEGEERGVPQSVSAFPDSGYVVLRHGKDGSLWFDAGGMGPRHLPGHGHADALSFSLFAAGRWLIVDPGVYSYHDRTWRDHFRSTCAHNTVTVDGQDQCVFWGPFRVAYPPEVRLLEWSGDHAVGEHNGYRRLQPGVLHRRRVQRLGEGAWEIYDGFDGQGEHEFDLTLQFAPGCRVRSLGLGCEVSWSDGACLQVVCVAPPRKAKARVEAGWVSPGWYVKESALRFVLNWRTLVPTACRLELRVSHRPGSAPPHTRTIQTS